MILLSILIPSIPSRNSKLMELWRKLERQVTDEVEIFCLLDNKQRSIGMKRDAMVQNASGMFLAFVDDDDDVSDEYCSKILAAIDRDPLADVIVFPTICRVEQNAPVTIRHGLKLENTEWDAPVPTRKPWMCHPWRADLAKASRFPDSNYREDAWWLTPLWSMAQRETVIEEPLYRYTYASAVSEARP